MHVDEEDEQSFTLEELRAASPRCTDAGNADAFIERHGAGYRFVLGWERWIAWNGKRWELDGAEGRVIQAALLSAREDYALTKVAIRDLEEEQRQARLKSDKDAVDAIEDRLKFQRYLLKWHEQSHNVSRLNACRSLLQSSLVVDHSDLDTHPWLLNAQNGTVDLRTGQLGDHDREHFLTQIAPVDFDPDALCPIWDAFLSTSLKSALMVLYLQRLLGYSITGLTTEHVLLFFYGEGNNGKSTFFTTVLNVLGEDYACAAPPDLLFMPRGGGAPHPTEIASLYGKRVASCAELGEGQHLDEAKVKRLTGGDPIRCRRMQEDWWTFAPTHTTFMAGNHKPKIPGTDLGIWRRVRLIPWLVTISASAVDKSLPSKLRREAAGILAWCVRGCLEWQRHGFAEPDTVVEATAEYRRESDLLGQFLEGATVRDPEGRVTLHTLRERYERWAKDNGYEVLGGRRFNERLRENGNLKCSVREGNVVRDGWRGLRLKTELELIMASEPDSQNEAS
jgi:putative DNA primase/helicase